MKALIVEDELRLGQLLKQGLAEHSFTVKLVQTCEAATDALADDHYDVIVLDLNLPDGDGLVLINEWRTSGFGDPIIILSARHGLDDRIEGLNLGADDYLPKPFSLDELVARMRAVVRRQSSSKQTMLKRGRVSMDIVGHLVLIDGSPVDLTGREYALLEIFMQNAGRVLTRSMISERIWSSDCETDGNLLDVYMSRLRNKLETTGVGPLFKTVRGIGYQLI